MSDVEAGGATVFPYLGLKLYPKKVSPSMLHSPLHISPEVYSKDGHAEEPNQRSIIGSIDGIMKSTHWAVFRSVSQQKEEPNWRSIIGSIDGIKKNTHTAVFHSISQHKEEPNWRSIIGTIDGIMKNTQQFFAQFLSLFVQQLWAFESCEDTTVSAAFLYSAMCVMDVINKASMCGKIVKVSYVC